VTVRNVKSPPSVKIIAQKHQKYHKIQDANIDFSEVMEWEN